MCDCVPAEVILCCVGLQLEWTAAAVKRTEQMGSLDAKTVYSEWKAGQLQNTYSNLKSETNYSTF